MNKRLLARQLKSLGLSVDQAPSLADWQAFLDRVERAYGEADQERYLLERSLLISSEEMQERWRIIELERARSAVSGKMASLGEMAGGVAHEINTPLAIISLVSEQALEVMDEPQPDYELVKSFLRKTQDTTRRIAKIVKGLRTFSRDGNEDPFLETSIEVIVEDTLAFCRERFKVNGIKLIYENLTPEAKLECRPTQLSQVILNLLNNSFDAVSKMNEKWIRLRTELSGGQARITVEDSGSGISTAIQDKIFQPFFTTKEIGKGTGLGLSLTKGIVDAHHGSLSLDTSSPRTSFLVSLPLRQPR